jgi:hypothetical protein
MPDSFGKRQRREKKERKAAAREERKQARRANPEAYRGWEDVPGAVVPPPVDPGADAGTGDGGSEPGGGSEG